MTVNDATRAQIDAANPGTSTWLSANAGSGKTRVLTDRVARLLIDGTPPQRILCLTYTKAAASEMQNRLFSRLGAWAMLEDRDLAKDLDDLGLEPTRNTPATRAAARTLFARAIETPGGLKIQTIHSFCGTVLRRFPLEAGVSPGFAEIDEPAARKLRQAALDAMTHTPDGGAALDGIADLVGDTQIDKFLNAVLAGWDGTGPSITRDAVLDWFGLNPDITEASVAADLFDDATLRLLEQMQPVLAAGKTTDTAVAKGFADVLRRNGSLARLHAIQQVLLTQKGTPLKKVPTKDTAKALGPLLTAFEDLTDRVVAARDACLALAAADRTARVMAFAATFRPLYDRAKAAQGALDFDDLIQRTRALLTRPGIAQWVLFRLDGGIDHILVDEAQDTSPVQWDVIRLLAQDFTSGHGARNDVTRTIFVVGDQKQSIYSFQGADPAGFDQMRDHFRTALGQVEAPFQSRSLDYSFRSSGAILRAVDASFAGDAARGLLSPPNHLAFFGSMPGRVDLWPVEPEATNPEDPDWRLPVGTESPDNPKLVLARRVAAFMKEQVDRGACLTDAKGRTRQITPGDFLILVQRRSEIFHEVIRACKECGLPVAGADRLRVGAELAVRDVIAVLSFLSTPEDDLSLAISLRSPLFDWSEGALFNLAHGRGGFLWERLRAGGDEHAETLNCLQDLLGQVDFLRPFDLIDRILTRHGGRQRLLARLGDEAEDGIDALLSQALAYEASNTPSLTGFLTWFREDSIEIKRQLDDAGDRVRVMTVHGAKGLEAPIVILPDTAVRRPPDTPLVLPAGDGMLAWMGKADEAPDRLAAIRAEHAARQDEERARLLYVAMTRAESWLVIAAAGKTGAPGQSWYATAHAGLEAAGAVAQDFDTGPGLRLQTGPWPDDTAPVRDGSVAVPPALPPWALAHAPAEPGRSAVVTPSALGGPKSLGGGGADATRLGDAIHLLLEHLPDLPRAAWPGAAQTMLERAGLAATVPSVDGLCTKVAELVDDPALGDVFSANTLREVTVTAPTPLGRLSGAIDRLVVPPAPAPILAVDFKSNARVPAGPDTVPDGLLRQMGAYAHALGAIYPDRRVETALLWTETGHLMRLPPDLVAAAFARSSPLDADGAAS